ncbi:hypothetical protein SCALM49S_06236 [Streptomyces californicus]
MRAPSTASRPSSTVPVGSTTRHLARTVLSAARGAIRRIPPWRSRSQACSPAPRHPAVSPRAAGTMWGSFWNVTRSSTAARSGVNNVSPASASPPPMMSVPGSSRVSAVTRPAASASIASRQTAIAAGSPASTALAQSAASASGSPSGGPGPGSPRLAEAQRLQAAALAAAAVGAVGADHDVADLAGVAVGARLDLPRDATGPGYPACRAGRGSPRSRPASLCAPRRVRLVRTSWPRATGRAPSRSESRARSGTSRQPRSRRRTPRRPFRSRRCRARRPRRRRRSRRGAPRRGPAAPRRTRGWSRRPRRRRAPGRWPACASWRRVPSVPTSAAFIPVPPTSRAMNMFQPGDNSADPQRSVH